MKGGAPVSAVYALDVERSRTHDTRIKRNAPTKEQDKRTRASHPHRTFHLGLIVRDDLLVLLESRGGHRSSGSQGDTLQVGGSVFVGRWSGLALPIFSFSTAREQTRCKWLLFPQSAHFESPYRRRNNTRAALQCCIILFFPSAFPLPPPLLLLLLPFASLLLPLSSLLPPHSSFLFAPFPLSPLLPFIVSSLGRVSDPEVTSAGHQTESWNNISQSMKNNSFHFITSFICPPSWGVKCADHTL